MVHTTRAAAAAALTLMALTGCGKAAADATPPYIYSPLPAFSTATPAPAEKPVPSVSPSPSPSPIPTPSEENVAGTAAGASTVDGPAQESVPEEAAAQPAPGRAVAQQPAPGGMVAQQPAPMTGPPVGGGPVQLTERTTDTTTAVTSTRVEGRVRILVTCEGRCMLGDLAAPGLTGEDGPISEEQLQQALEQALTEQGADGRLMTDDLAAQLTQGKWDLADRFLEDGNEKLVFAATGQ